MMIKNGKKIDSFVVFAKIILYITIFLKFFFRYNVQNMSIQGASGSRVTNNKFYHDFLHAVKIVLKFSF